MNVRELPAHDLTRLVLDPNELRQPTQECSTDSTTALTRGLAEYVASLVGPGGERLFQKCFDAWPRPEDDASYPSFVAYTNDNDGDYEAATLAASVSPTRYPNGQYEVSSSALVVDIKCEVHATDPEERQQLCSLLELAFGPVEWMHGFRLALPHYFSQRATYMPSRITYQGAEAEALQSYVNARLIVRGVVPVTRVLPFAQGQPQVRTQQVTTGELTPPPNPTRPIIRGR